MQPPEPPPPPPYRIIDGGDHPLKAFLSMFKSYRGPNKEAAKALVKQIERNIVNRKVDPSRAREMWKSVAQIPVKSPYGLRQSLRRLAQNVVKSTGNSGGPK